MSLLTELWSSYGTAKSGVGISAMSVLRPDLMMKCVVPVIMAGIIAVSCCDSLPQHYLLILICRSMVSSFQFSFPEAVCFTLCHVGETLNHDSEL